MDKETCKGHDRPRQQAQGDHVQAARAVSRPGTIGLAIDYPYEVATSEAMPTPIQPAPTRVTITVPYEVFTRLRDRADHEGRSTSNLAAFLLERNLRPVMPPPRDLAF